MILCSTGPLHGGSVLELGLQHGAFGSEAGTLTLGHNRPQFSLKRYKKEWIPFVDPILGEDNKFHLGGVAKDVYEGMKESDISGPYFIDEDRSLAVEFSDPMAFSQLTIVSGLISSNRDPFLILAVFSMPVK
ncbi:hypothetical protein AVEN_219577-1 [Araneus ventricosus]|uniref:Uncharacterized protein n=1 Tax=Araneus ventricosus TaxID=182803 RepID=A0A4Y2MTZ3_ARAVE|nr:hypothetical protein AVEN_219577-1 [Araneus ventricosus]